MCLLSTTHHTQLEAPLFITLSQCAVATVCFMCLGTASKYASQITFPPLDLNLQTAMKVSFLPRLSSPSSSSSSFSSYEKPPYFSLLLAWYTMPSSIIIDTTPSIRYTIPSLLLVPTLLQSDTHCMHYNETVCCYETACVNMIFVHLSSCLSLVTHAHRHV